MKKVLALTISSLFLVASVSGGESDTNMAIAEPSLADISGVWDMSIAMGNQAEVNVLYWSITEFGEFKAYDYAGDSYENGANCYRASSETITDLGGGAFEISNSESGEFITLNFSITDDQLVWDDSYNFPRTALEDFDFVPSCGEYSEVSTTN